MLQSITHGLTIHTTLMIYFRRMHRFPSRTLESLPDSGDTISVCPANWCTSVHCMRRNNIPAAASKALKVSEMVLQRLTLPYSLQLAIADPVFCWPHLQVVCGCHGHAVCSCTRFTLTSGHCTTSTHNNTLLLALNPCMPASTAGGADNHWAATGVYSSVDYLHHGPPSHLLPGELPASSPCPESLQTRRLARQCQRCPACRCLHRNPCRFSAHVHTYLQQTAPYPSTYIPSAPLSAQAVWHARQAAIRWAHSGAGETEECRFKHRKYGTHRAQSAQCAGRRHRAMASKEHSLSRPPQ